MNGMSVRKLAVLACLGIALAGCGGGAGKSTSGLPTTGAGLPRGSGLVLFRRPGFSVGVLPGKPERFASSFEGSGANVKLVLYLARGGNAATEVGSVATTFDDAAIKTTIDGAARSAGGTLAEETTTTYDGLPAHDARIAGIGGGKGTYYLRVIAAKHTGYVLGYVLDGDHTTPPAQLRTFLASLTIE